MLLFFRLGGLCAGTSGSRTRPRRSRGAGLEKTECMWQAEEDTELTLSASSATAVGQSTLTLAN